MRIVSSFSDVTKIQGWLTKCHQKVPNRIVRILCVACIKDVSGDISLTKLLASAQDDGSYDAWPWVGWMCCDVPKTFHFQWESQKIRKSTLTLVEVLKQWVYKGLQWLWCYMICDFAISSDTCVRICYDIRFINRYWYDILTSYGAMLFDILLNCESLNYYDMCDRRDVTWHGMTECDMTSSDAVRCDIAVQWSIWVWHRLWREC